MTTLLTVILNSPSSPTSTTPTSSGADIVTGTAADWSGPHTTCCLRFDVQSIDPVRLSFQGSVDAFTTPVDIGVIDPLPGIDETEISRWFSIPSALRSASTTLRVRAVALTNPVSPIKTRFLEVEART